MVFGALFKELGSGVAPTDHVHMLKGKVSDLLGWVSSRLGILKFFSNRKVPWLTPHRKTYIIPPSC